MLKSQLKDEIPGITLSDESRLRENLTIISQRIVEEASGSISKGKYHEHRRRYCKPRFDDGRYQASNAETVEKKEWQLNKHDIESSIKDSSEFKQILNEISQLDCDRVRIDYFLEGLLHRFIFAVIEETVKCVMQSNKPTADFLNDCINATIHELKGEPTDWVIKVWLNGLGLDKHEHKVGEWLVIRKPRAEDVEVALPRDLCSLTYDPNPLNTLQLPTVVLEITHQSTRFHLRSNIVRRHVDVVLSCLQLFRVCSVFKTRIAVDTKSPLGGAIPKEAYTPERISQYSYTMTESDLLEFDAFIQKTRHLFPKDYHISAYSGKGQASSDLIDPGVISLQRYNQALFETVLEGKESRIAYTMMCLEALYVTDNEEIKRKISQRTAALLGMIDGERLKPVTVYKDVKDAYDIRSSFLHGSSTSLPRAEIEALGRRILEYVRISLNIFVQLGKISKGGKENLVSDIDDALLSQSRYDSLKRQVKAGIILNVKTEEKDLNNLFLKYARST